MVKSFESQVFMEEDSQLELSLEGSLLMSLCCSHWAQRQLSDLLVDGDADNLDRVQVLLAIQFCRSLFES